MAAEPPEISMAGCFYAFLLLSATDFGFYAKFWPAILCVGTLPRRKTEPKKGQDGSKMPVEAAKVGRVAPDSLQNPLGGRTCAPVTGAKVLLE